MAGQKKKKKKISRGQNSCVVHVLLTSGPILSSTTAAVSGLGLDTVIDMPLVLNLDHNLGECRAAGVLLESTHHLQELVEFDRSRVVQVNLKKKQYGRVRLAR